MKIAVGADHRGFEHKQYIVDTMTNIEWLDVGAFNIERSDFPIFTKDVCEMVLNNKAERGILICGSGIGMSIAANRYKRIYAALVWNDSTACSSTEHNHANVLVLPSDYVSKEEMINMIKIWLAAKPLDGRYQERILMIDKLD